jgi:hypothetical protein
MRKNEMKIEKLFIFLLKTFFAVTCQAFEGVGSREEVEGVERIGKVEEISKESLKIFRRFFCDFQEVFLRFFATSLNLCLLSSSEVLLKLRV